MRLESFFCSFSRKKEWSLKITDNMALLRFLIIYMIQTQAQKKLYVLKVEISNYFGNCNKKAHGWFNVLSWKFSHAVYPFSTFCVTMLSRILKKIQAFFFWNLMIVRSVIFTDWKNINTINKLQLIGIYHFVSTSRKISIM